MNNVKRAQVIILLTDNKTNIFKILSTNRLISFPNKTINEKLGFHLYIISDDEIKEGDWYIHSGITQEKERYSNIYQCHKGTRKLEKANHRPDVLYTDGMFTSDCKKVIATTDNTLTIDDSINKNKVNYLPQPSQQFIEKYIESYNKSNIITDVLVEYEYRGKEYVDDQDAYGYDKQVLKINSKDNTITIKKLKDNWSREEVKKLMLIAYSNASGYVECLNNNETQRFLSFSEVIEKNL